MLCYKAVTVRFLLPLGDSSYRQNENGFRLLPPGYPGEAMNEDVPNFPTLIDEIKARLEVVEQVLRLRVPQRHGHPRDPQAVPSALHHPHQRPGGHCSCRWCALLAGDDSVDLLRWDCEARAAVGDEGDGGGADDREDVGKGRGGGGLREGGDGVFDIAEVEPLANEVRHGDGDGGRDG